MNRAWTMPTIDISKYLAPISQQLSCGEDMSFSSDFHTIQKARIEDDLSLDQGDWVTEPKIADWSFVDKQSSKLLLHQSKDIRLVCWLNEAWTHLYGFSGLASSLELLQSLVDLYWEDIHPRVIDDDLDQRLGILQGCINAIPHLIRLVPLVPQNNNLHLLYYEQLRHNYHHQLKQLDESQLTHHELEQFEQSIAQCSVAFSSKNYDDFLKINTQWTALKYTLNQHMHDQAPRFADLDSKLEQFQHHLKKIYKIEEYKHKDHIPIQPLPDQSPIKQSPSMPQPGSDPTAQQQTSNDYRYNDMQVSTSTTMFNEMSFQPQAHLHQQNRQHALQLLQQISAYFAANEPHSPVSYLLNKTILWSQLPLDQWLALVIKNEYPLQSIQELLGVTEPHQNE